MCSFIVVVCRLVVDAVYIHRGIRTRVGREVSPDTNLQPGEMLASIIILVP